MTEVPCYLCGAEADAEANTLLTINPLLCKKCEPKARALQLAAVQNALEALKR